MIAADGPRGPAIELALNHGRYLTEIVDSVRAAKRTLADWRPHLMVVDLDLRSGGALELVGERLASRRVPVIVFTTRGDLKTKLEAFDRGADDFVMVPFSPEELIARTIAVIRRTYGETVPITPAIRVGELEVDLLEQRVRVGSLRVKLTSIEQAMLYFLASHAGEVLDRATILDAVWGSDFIADSNLIDRHIRNLRVKLHDDWRKPRYIETVAGKGYRFHTTTNSAHNDKPDRNDRSKNRGNDRARRNRAAAD